MHKKNLFSVKKFAIGIMMRLTPEKLWQQKLDTIPLDIIRRLELDNIAGKDTLHPRCLIAGLGWEAMLSSLNQAFLDKADGKVFINVPEMSDPSVSVLRTPNGATPTGARATSEEIGGLSLGDSGIVSTSPTGRLVFLEGNLEAKLDAFPAKTFDLVILLWSLSLEQPMNTLHRVYRVLKGNRPIALVTPLANSSERPLRLIKKISEQHDPFLSLRMLPSNLPKGTQQLRRMMTKVGFKDSRIWEDMVECHYTDGGRLFDDLTQMSPVGIFQELVNQEKRQFIRRRFIELFGQSAQAGNVKFGFAGATAFK